MALDKHLTKFIQSNVPSLGDVLTLGRLHLGGTNDFCEEYLKDKLKAFSVESIDIDRREEPTRCYDLGKDTPHRNLKNKYDTIIDGGTLEHVYNFPNAIQNVSDMLKLGGYFISSQLLNYTGHGLYTLSPEVLIKACLLNGLEPKCIKIARALGPLKTWFNIPIQTKKRIEISSISPLMMHFVAQKDVKKLTNVIQSDATIDAGPVEHFLWNTRLWNQSLK